VFEIFKLRLSKKSIENYFLNLTDEDHFLGYLYLSCILNFPLCICTFSLSSSSRCSTWLSSCVGII